MDGGREEVQASVVSVVEDSGRGRRRVSKEVQDKVGRRGGKEADRGSMDGEATGSRGAKGRDGGASRKVDGCVEVAF